MALRPNTGIPFEATYDPTAAGDYARSGAGITAPGPMESGPVRQEAPASTVGISGDGMWWVNGKEFHRDDHQSAVESQSALDGPERPMPEGYRVVSPDEYKGYLRQIIDPSMGRLVKKNFGIGVDNLQLLGGYGMQLAGAEKAGQAVVETQVEDLRKNQPYQRTFTEDAASDPVGWFVANLAQQGPNLIESALSAIAGGIVGGLAGGGANPFTAIGGAMMALGGKEGVKQSILAIAKKKAAGEALEAAEMKLLRETAAGAYAFNMKGAAKDVLKRGTAQGRVGGAAAATFASNYGIGAADVYGEQLDSGTPNRAVALGLAIPYALAESAPELLALGFFTKGVKGGRLKRGLKGAGAGIVGEGSTEAFQETLLLGQNEEVDINSKEGIHRLINSFAAGAGVGGAIGGGGALLRGNKGEKPARNLDKEELDLLAIEDQTERSIEQGDEQLGIEDQRDAAQRDGRLEGPEDMLALTGPEYGVDVNEVIQGENRAAEARGGPVTTDPVITAPYLPTSAGPPIDVAPMDDTQRDPATMRTAAFDAYEAQQAEQAQAEQIQQQNVEVMQQPTDTGIGVAMQQAQAQQVAQQQAEQQALQVQQAQQAQIAQDDETNAAAQPVYGPQLPQTQMALPPSVINTEPNLPRKVDLTRKQSERETDSPMILMPTVVEDGPQAGQTVMVPVSADEVYNESKSGIDALQRLAKCLGGGGT